MYAPHFAAAMAIKSKVPRAPFWALMTGAFLPDLLWIALARIGVEPADAQQFFDDWSHSLLSVLIIATLFALLFRSKGGAVTAAIWLAVSSHFLLDLPVHPKRLALFPFSNIHLGWDLAGWGSTSGWLGIANDWWLQLFVLLGLMLVYVQGSRAGKMPATQVVASCIIVVSAQLLMLSSCISY